MSGNKVVGSAGAGAAATLPLTGSPTITLVAGALAMMGAGLLLFRFGRIRKSDAA
jgi:LPXTG-motif cell wall-anchored protein